MSADELPQLAGREQLSAALTDDLAGGTSAGPGRDLPIASSNRLSLVLLDIDRFATLVTQLGRENAERVLDQIAARLRAPLRPNQLLVRLDGDEFAVVLPEATREVAERVAQSLLTQLDDEFEVDLPQGAHNRLRVSASAGVATCWLPSEDAGQLVRKAAIAVRQAKASGGGISHYRDDPDGDTARRPPIGELRVALENDGIEVFLQPQIDLRTGRVHGCEALARWRHPRDGVLLPASFLPLAHATGLMRSVTTAVFAQAIQACRQWWQEGLEVPVSLNLSATDLLDGALSRTIRDTLLDCGLPGQALRIEITEDVFLAEPEAVGEVLHAWRKAGVTAALDDFGTGYSSLSYLRQVPLAELKLDKSFTTDVMRPTTATIIKHTVAMAHELGMIVVAEGIEDDATVTVLEKLGCDVGQGVHFSDAIPLPEFLDFLRSHTQTPA